MNNPWPALQSWLGPFAWTVVWQTSLWLIAGLLAGRLLRRRAARAHLALVLATVAAAISPALTATIRHLEWGILPAKGSAAIDAIRVADLVAASGQTGRIDPGLSTPHAFGSEELGTQQDPIADSPASRPAAQFPDGQTNTRSMPSGNSWWIGLVNRVSSLLLGIWLLCSLVLSLRLALSLVRGGRLVQQAAPETHPKLLAAVREAVGRLALPTEPVLRTSAAARCPMIWCWRRRPVLLTPRLAALQDGVAWRDVFCHELAHWLRRDHWSALWADVVVIAVPWQPLAWRARRRLAALRELACDDWVLAVVGDATDYAQSLLNLVPQGSPAYALAAVRSHKSLKARLEHVLAGVRVSPAIGRRWIAAAVACALSAATGVALAQQRTAATAEKTATTTASAASPPGQIKLLPAKDENNGTVTIRGQVLKPDGQPAAGARVSARYYDGDGRLKQRNPLAAAATGADGRFEISYRKSQIANNFGRGADWTDIVAVADGLGLQWTSVREIDASKPLALKLVPDFPIRGRVIDLEGKPVEAVTVRVLSVRSPKDGEDLSPWLDAVKSGVMTNGLSQKLGPMLSATDDESQPPITTNRDGHFAITGLGAERDVRLELRGDTIAYRQMDVATRNMKPLTRTLWFYAGADRPPIMDQVFGADFSFQALPTKPIVGTLRDAATGKPLAGVSVESEHLAGTIVHPNNVLRTATDAQGHYRLIGMPKGNGPDMSGRNRIAVVPHADQPYFTRRLDVADTPGLSPVTADIELRRGVWITGRVIDKATGKPVSAQMFYFPFLSNPFAKIPEFDPRGNFGGGYETRDQTRPDGSFRVVGLPGRAIVAAWAIGSSYRKGVGASEIPGMRKDGSFPTYRNPTFANVRFYDALKEINPPEGKEMVNCDFVLDPGATVRLTVVDREGKPVSGCSVLGRKQGSEVGETEPLGSTFDVTSLSPNESRQLAILHKERNIGKILVLKYDEKTPRAMTVTLEPCATLVGRLVDDEGVPFKGVELQASPAPGSYPWFFIPIVVCRADGKFECRGLMPGCDYGLAVHGGEVKVQFPYKKIAIDPGKTIALGDIKLKRRPE